VEEMRRMGEGGVEFLGFNLGFFWVGLFVCLLRKWIFFLGKLKNSFS
jgi:hypothetical protein